MVAECIALAGASCALTLAAVWADFPLPLVIGVAFLPGLPAWFVLFRRAPQTPKYLYMHPHRSWTIGDSDNKNTQPLQLKQKWQHFFGLTLSLKILNCPHNKQETVRMTVWRCNIAPDVYRRMCVMVAWRLDQPRVEQKMETV